MPTARNNLTNDAWTLIGSGAFDLQREDSRETILLYFGSSSPAIDSVHHARIVDNQVYYYRGTNNVYARSLDAQAFLISTPIAVSSSAGDASAANQVTQSTKLDSIITNLATLISNIGTGLAKSAKQSLTFITSKVVTIGATSDFSGTVNASTTRVVLSSDIKCWVTIGASPTAVVGGSGSFYLPANVMTQPIDVTGSTTKIAVIGLDATAGKLSIFESS